MQAEETRFICNWDGQYADGEPVSVGEWLLCQFHFNEHGGEVHKMHNRRFLEEMAFYWRMWGLI